MSAHIKDNVFTEAGITILSTSTNSHQSVVLENNIFQGNKTNTILQVLNTTNIIIASSVFQNSHLSFRHIVDYNANSGVFCYNSHVEMHDSLFKNVTFFPVLKFENCSFVSNNLTMIENDLSAFTPDSDRSERYSMVRMTHSEATLENSRFESNFQLYCFWVTGGNITFLNMVAVGNNMVQVGQAWNGTLTINNASIINNTASIFYFADSMISILSCAFKHYSDLLMAFAVHVDGLFTFERTDVTITDSVFEGNNGEMTILGRIKKSAFIASSHFRFNHNMICLFCVNSQWLQIISSVFENNDGSGSVMNVQSGNVVINGSTFSRNHHVVLVSNGLVEFTSCLFNTNYAPFSDLIAVHSGSMWFTDCSFWNNTASFDAGVFLASNSEVVLQRCTAANNSASSKSGVILVTDHSSLFVESSTFENNACGVEGGAIRAHRNTSLKISHTIFLSNTALGADGGAIILEDDSSMISDSCQFIGNRAALGGGAVMVIDHSSYSDTGSTFTNNIAADNGIFIPSNTLQFHLLEASLEYLGFHHFSHFLGGAISVHDHSALNCTSTNFTGNKAESIFDHNNQHCPSGT